MPTSFPQRFGAPEPDFELVGADGDLTVTRTSLFTRKRNTMRLPIDRASFGRWLGGNLIQTVFPDLTDDQREFLMSGATPEEWAGIFGGEDD